MSHALPLTGSPLRELFDVADVVAITQGTLPVHTSDKGLILARRTMRENKAVRAIVYFAVDASTDKLCLYRAGNRGGYKRLWTFGPVGRHARLA